MMPTVLTGWETDHQRLEHFPGLGGKGGKVGEGKDRGAQRSRGGEDANHILLFYNHSTAT